MLQKYEKQINLKKKQCSVNNNQLIIWQDLQKKCINKIQKIQEEI